MSTKKQMTAGKTYVYETIKNHRYEIQVLRRKIKHKKPRPLPKNWIWSLDLTQVCDHNHQQHTLFGIVDSACGLVCNYKISGVDHAAAVPAGYY